MSDVLAERYRTVLRVYPASFRTSQGEDLLGILLDGARPGQRWPARREVLSMLLEGARARLGAGGPRHPGQVLLDGVRIAVLVLLARAGADTVINAMGHEMSARAAIAAGALALLAFAAALRDRPAAALGLAVAWQLVQARSQPVSWHLFAAAVLLLALLAARLGAGGGPRAARPAAWMLAAPVMLALAYGPQLWAGPTAYLYSYQQYVIVMLGLAGAVGAVVDARVTVAAAGLLLGEALRELVVLPLHDGLGVRLELTGSWWGATMAGATLALLLLAQQTARRRARL
jgi:hypothetical protein